VSVQKSVAARKMRLNPESPELQVGDSDSVRKIWNSKLLQTAAHKKKRSNLVEYRGLFRVDFAVDAMS
jgi:hypothetical protein